MADGFERVRWSPGNPAREATDLDTFAHSLVLPGTNANEWYFPLRLLIDMGALNLDLTGVPNFVPHSVVGVPTLAVGAGRGLVTTTDGFSSYGNLRASSFSPLTSSPALPISTCSPPATTRWCRFLAAG